MDLSGFKHKLTEQGITFEEQAVLAPFTTWKIGGPADVLIRLKDKTFLPMLLKLAHDFEVPATYLGGGSNVLISDQGIRGLVIKNELTGISIDTMEQNIDTKASLEARLIQMDTKDYYDFSQLDYDESAAPAAKVTIKSGTLLAYADNFLIQNGITGLQWFAGIPGTIGGAVYNNIHGGSHFFSEFVAAVTAIDRQGNELHIPKAELGFDYDYSDLQKHDYLVTEVELILHHGDKERAAKTAMSWAQQKKEKQPFNSAGCCFKNLSEEQRLALKLPGNGWGYIIDKILGLKGQVQGGAQISMKHAAFIENKGNATAADILTLFDRIYTDSAQKLQGTTPKTEIFFMGFPPEQISRFR